MNEGITPPVQQLTELSIPFCETETQCEEEFAEEVLKRQAWFQDVVMVEQAGTKIELLLDLLEHQVTAQQVIASFGSAHAPERIEQLPIDAHKIILGTRKRSILKTNLGIPEVTVVEWEPRLYEDVKNGKTPTSLSANIRDHRIVLCPAIMHYPVTFNTHNIKRNGYPFAGYMLHSGTYTLGLDAQGILRTDWSGSITQKIASTQVENWNQDVARKIEIFLQKQSYYLQKPLVGGIPGQSNKY